MRRLVNPFVAAFLVLAEEVKAWPGGDAAHVDETTNIAFAEMIV